VGIKSNQMGSSIGTKSKMELVYVLTLSEGVGVAVRDFTE